MWRVEPDGRATPVGAWERSEPVEHWPVDARPLAELHGATPIVVDGATWGVLSTHTADGARVSETIPDQLTAVAGVVAKALASSEAARLTDEQTALRRIATLVAEGLSPDRLFAMVTEEVGRLFATDAAALLRAEGDDFATVLGSWRRHLDAPGVPLGTRLPTAGGSLTPRILRTGRPARIDDWSNVPGLIAEIVRASEAYTSSVDCPILVEGRVWGALTVHATGGAKLPADTEDRLSRFSHLVATAIMNAQAREELRRLASEQAALRRVATLVSRPRRSCSMRSRARWGSCCASRTWP